MEKDIKKITIENKNYPKALREIKKVPKTLYFKGEIKSNELCFAIVGTRRCSSYGKQVALEIAGNLAEAGITIVSGLAPGIDTFAHTAVVEQGKRTIAVLGTGLDEKSIYPKENIKLANKIVELGGCLISEYPPGTPGSRFTFPDRNRIISGLSLGALVVEAKEKSGALITANYALSQKRKLFAIPGPIYALNSQGPHILIKKGAKLVDNANDILQELNLPASLRSPEDAASLRADETLQAGLLTPPPLSRDGPQTLEENLILNTLKEETLGIDKIIEKTKLKAATVASILTVLEIKGRIRNLGSNIYGLSR